MTLELLDMTLCIAVIAITIALVAHADLQRVSDAVIAAFADAGFAAPHLFTVEPSEGPHRDGHDFVMNAVFSRHNITGGVSQLMPTGGGTCFFEDVLQPLEAIVMADDQMWHHATDILPAGPGPGHRDILIVSFNAWERRRYGEAFERRLGALDHEPAVAP